MEIAQHIIDEAASLLQAADLTLPLQLRSAPAFFLAQADDATITAFAAITHSGVEYKIGTMNS
jgi:CHASE1-domain containing sensor protein